MDLMTVYKPAAAEAVARWTDPERRPLFKGSLIDWSAYTAAGGGDGGDAALNGCACAQGDVLLHNGFSPSDLRRMAQADADAKTAELLGISITHAILLRTVNDSEDGAPEIVLTHPEKVLGDQAPTILAFWWHLDRMTVEDWKKARDARAAWAAWDARAARDAWAAWDARAAWAARDARDARAAWAAWDARAARDARDAWAARDARAAWAAWAARAARDVAYAALAEIAGVKWLPEHERGEFVFLPMFGFADPAAVLAADKAARATA